MGPAAIPEASDGPASSCLSPLAHPENRRRYGCAAASGLAIRSPNTPPAM
jgi:hypothetical protein